MTTIVARTDAAVVAGLLYGVHTDGKIKLATNLAGSVVQALGVALRAYSLAQVTTNKESVTLYPRGKVKCSASEIEGGAFTTGATVYLHTTGFYTTTRPTTANTLIQPVGIAISATEVLVDIQPSALKAQAAGTSLVTGI